MYIYISMYFCLLTQFSNQHNSIKAGSAVCVKLLPRQWRMNKLVHEQVIDNYYSWFSLRIQKHVIYIRILTPMTLFNSMLPPNSNGHGINDIEVHYLLISWYIILKGLHWGLDMWFTKIYLFSKTSIVLLPTYLVYQNVLCGTLTCPLSTWQLGF